MLAVSVVRFVILPQGRLSNGGATSFERVRGSPTVSVKNPKTLLGRLVLLTTKPCPLPELRSNPSRAKCLLLDTLLALEAS
jgi:hypothetical protein